ncbi:MAG: HD domain-containing protein, partial [Treponema sp.]|nr:HD domain-containing protein [Treponema sp.]
MQIFNLIIDIRFILTRRANVTGSRKAGSFLDFLILVMVLLFCAVYLIIFFVKLQTVWVGILLFAGAVFVTTVLLWINTLTKEIRDSAFSISETLIGIVEARDPNLNGHSLHVQELSLLIYNNLPAGFKRRINEENLKYAALFHDVGKLGVPEAILNKPASLSPEEWNVMRRHPEISVQILRPLKSFDLIKEWILYHHERIDGSGYFGIPGDKIPFAARIISVADTYSAITMARSYKPGKSHEEAIEILQRV